MNRIHNPLTNKTFQVTAADGKPEPSEPARIRMKPVFVALLCAGLIGAYFADTLITNHKKTPSMESLNEDYSAPTYSSQSSKGWISRFFCRGLKSPRWCFD